MKQREKYLIKNTAIFTVGNMGTKVVNMLMVPLYSYVLTTAEYGNIDLVFTICTLIEPIIMCNIGEGVKRYALDKNINYNQVMTVSFIWIILGVLVGGPILYIVNTLYLHSELLLLIYIYTVLLAMNNVLLSYLKGIENLISFTIISILTTFLIASFNVLFLLKFRMGVRGYFYSYILAYFVACLIAAVLGGYCHIFERFDFNKKMFIEISKFSLVLVPNSLIWWIINSSDRVMVSSLCGFSENGIYSISSKIPSLMSTVGGIFNQAWQYSAIKEKDSEDEDQYNSHIFLGLVGILCLAAGAVIICTKIFYKIIISPAYFAAWKSSVILTVGFTFLTLATFVGTAYYVEKNMRGNLLSSLLGGVLNIVLNFMFITKTGAIGAALATAITYAFIFIYRYIDTQKYQKIKLPKDFYIQLLLLAIITIVTLLDSAIHYTAIIAYVVLIMCNMDLIKSFCKLGLAMIKRRS